MKQIQASTRRRAARLAARFGVTFGVLGAGALTLLPRLSSGHHAVPWSWAVLAFLGVTAWAGLCFFFDLDAQRLGARGGWVIWVLNVPCFFVVGQSQLDWVLRWAIVGAILFVDFGIWLRAVGRARVTPTPAA